MLNTAKPFVFLALLDVTSHEPSDYLGKNKPNGLGELAFSFSFQEAIGMQGSGRDPIGLSNLFSVSSPKTN